MLLDSNTVIYAAIPEYSQLRKFLAQYSLSVSAISLIEVLGYHKLTQENKQYFQTFFSNDSCAAGF